MSVHPQNVAVRCYGTRSVGCHRRVQSEFREEKSLYRNFPAIDFCQMFQRILRISPDISCKSLNEEVAQNVTCSLKTVQSKRLLSLDAYIVPTAQRIFVQAHLQYAREPTMKVITMNITEDLCEFLHGRKRQAFLSIAFSNMRHLFYNLQCPTQVKSPLHHEKVLSLSGL